MDQNIKPKVTIILPVYNSALYVEAAIKSVLGQTFRNFEFLIIDDGSSDESVELIKKFTDERIRLVENGKNLGLIATLNKGLQEAKGDLIARIDADDEWLGAEKLEKQVTYLETNSDCVLVGTWGKALDENNHLLFDMTPASEDSKIRSRILIKNSFLHPSVVFRKNAATSSLGFRNDELFVEDYGLWMRLGKIGKFHNIPEFLIYYRIHQKGVTNQNNRRQVANSIDLIKKHKKDYPNYWIANIKWNLRRFLNPVRFWVG